MFGDLSFTIYNYRLPLALFVFWFLTDNSYYTLSANDNTLFTDFFDRWTDFHRNIMRKELSTMIVGICSWNSYWSIRIWLTEGDATTGKIIRSELDSNSISRNKTNPIFLHFSSDIRTNHHI